jgi:hypothetical protein
MFCRLEGVGEECLLPLCFASLCLVSLVVALVLLLPCPFAFLLFKGVSVEGVRGLVAYATYKIIVYPPKISRKGEVLVWEIWNKVIDSEY